MAKLAMEASAGVTWVTAKWVVEVLEAEALAMEGLARVGEWALGSRYPVGGWVC